LHCDPDGRLLAESTGSGVPAREYIWLPLKEKGRRKKVSEGKRCQEPFAG
jgi:hypothetical protein